MVDFFALPSDIRNNVIGAWVQKVHKQDVPHWRYDRVMQQLESSTRLLRLRLDDECLPKDVWTRKTFIGKPHVIMKIQESALWTIEPSQKDRCIAH